jgi:hypothetical protein
MNWTDPEQGTTPAAKNSFTAATLISPTNRPVFPANSLSVGTQIYIHTWGSYGSAAGTATTTLGYYLNGSAGTQVIVSASATPPSSTVNVFHLEAWFTVLTIGSSGTIQGSGYIIGLGTTTTTPILLPATLPAAAAINTTTANSLDLVATWSSGVSGNTYTVYGHDVFQMN